MPFDYIDLHIHTHYSSDGDYSPAAILAMARSKNLRAIAIADHDCVTGSIEAIKLSQQYELEVIPCVEFTTFFAEKELHILGFFLDVDAPDVLQAIERIRRAEEIRMRSVVQRLQALGVDVSFEEAQQRRPFAISKHSMLIQAAMTNGRNRQLQLFRDYYAGPKAQQPYHQFYLDHMRQGGIAYVETNYAYSTLESIQLILARQGIPVLAHPGGSLHFPEDLALLQHLQHNGLMGLEVYSSYHTEEQETWFHTYCEQQHLLETAGSDFHGETCKPLIKLGDLRHHPYQLLEKLIEQRNRSL